MQNAPHCQGDSQIVYIDKQNKRVYTDLCGGGRAPVEIPVGSNGGSKPPPYRGCMKKQKRISLFIWLILIPLAVAAGVVLPFAHAEAVSIFAVALFALIPPLVSFEKKDHTAAEVMILASLVAFSSLARIAFFALPGVKPVTAVVVLAGVYLGCEAGFAVGALSALVSGMAFGLGSWTPFQMFAWGLIGLLAGVLARFLKERRVPLLLFGVLSGVLYSLLMDVWTVLTAEGSFALPRFAATVVTALPVTALYALSNAAFLFLLQKPARRIFDRLKTRYGVFAVRQRDGRSK